MFCSLIWDRVLVAMAKPRIVQNLDLDIEEKAVFEICKHYADVLQYQLQVFLSNVGLCIVINGY